MNTRLISSALQNKSKLALGKPASLLNLGYAVSRKYFAHQKLPFAQPSYSESKLVQPKPIIYSACKKALSEELHPTAFVDIDAFDYNIKKIDEIAEKNGKLIRPSTKSIRVPALIKRALEQGKHFKGVMCYSAQEAYDLFKEEKIDDLLIAYPTVQARDLEKLRAMHVAGAKVSLVVDDIEHIQQLSEAMKELEKPFPLLIELDISFKRAGGRIQLGARRSPVDSLENLKYILEKSRDFPNIKIAGVMAYESIVAGLQDENSPQLFRDPFAKMIRSQAAAEIAQMRSEVPKVFAEAGMKLEIFNGGGTGSINFAVNEKVLTDVTIGSALYCSHLFNNYSNIKGFFAPALFFTTPVVRCPVRTSNLSSNYPIITCSGGGIIGSGSIGKNKLPIPVLPTGLELIQDEGAGEVQTPLVVRGDIKPKIGEFVMWRPAKGGETLERFNEVVLVSNENKVGVAPTYRGKGRCYF